MTFSSTVMWMNGLSFWNVRATPSRLISSGRSRVMGQPSSSTSPASAGWNPVRRSNSVDLPAPLGPMMPTSSPAPALGERHDAAGLDHRDDHDQETVDEQVDGLARASQIDARRLAKGHQDGRADERPPERAHAAQDGDQADQDRKRQRQHRLRVDE